MAAVPDVVHRQNEAPTSSAKRFSKRDTIVPLVQLSVPDSMTRSSSSSSSRPSERPLALASDGNELSGTLMNPSSRCGSDRLRLCLRSQEFAGSIAAAPEMENRLHDPRRGIAIPERIGPRDRLTHPFRWSPRAPVVRGPIEHGAQHRLDVARMRAYEVVASA